MTDTAYRVWRRVHFASSGALAVLASLHAGLTPILYRRWDADAVWFLGTGLGLLLLSALNLTHLGPEPCRDPTAPVVRWANWAFFTFGIGALAAVPEIQALVIVAALAGQAVACGKTLPGPA